MNGERSAGASYPAVARSVRATVLSLPYPRNARLSLLALFPDNMVAHTTDKTCKTPIGTYAGRWFERFCRFRGRLRHCTGRSCRLSNYSMPSAVRTPSTVAAVQTQPTKLALFCRKVVLQVLSVSLAALRVLPLISIEIYVPRPSAPTARTSNFS